VFGPVRFADFTSNTDAGNKLQPGMGVTAHEPLNFPAECGNRWQVDPRARFEIATLQLTCAATPFAQPWLPKIVSLNRQPQIP
jgi:hypothetical protein